MRSARSLHLVLDASADLILNWRGALQSITCYVLQHAFEIEIDNGPAKAIMKSTPISIKAW
jgi:hypothetical protein